MHCEVETYDDILNNKNNCVRRAENSVLFENIYKVILNYCRVSVGYNFQKENKKIKLAKEYENVTQKVLFSNAILAALISGRKYVTFSYSVISFVLLFPF
jgi:hypothetical protein